MCALIIEHTRVNPYEITDIDEFAQIWCATEYIIERNKIRT